MKVVERNEIVMKFIPYLQKSLEHYGLGEEHLSDAYIFMSELIDRRPSESEDYYRHRTYCHIMHLAKKEKEKRAFEVLVSDVPEVSYYECNFGISEVHDIIEQIFSTTFNESSARRVAITKEYFYNEYTLSELGKTHCRAAETMRGLVAKTLRQLRHPSRANYLRDLLDYYN